MDLSGWYYIWIMSFVLQLQHFLCSNRSFKGQKYFSAELQFQFLPALLQGRNYLVMIFFPISEEQCFYGWSGTQPWALNWIHWMWIEPGAPVSWHFQVTIDYKWLYYWPTISHTTRSLEIGLLNVSWAYAYFSFHGKQRYLNFQKI